jgi:DNA-binding CsgD family transcriptional regulator
MSVPVLAISDRISRHDFRQLGLYHELYRLMNVEDQIAITLPSPWPVLIGIALSRPGWGFTARERAMLLLLRPHLLAAQSAAASMRGLQQQAHQWQQTLDCLPSPLIAVSREGVPLWQTAAARPLLDAYFPGSSRAAGGLPDLLRRWLREQWYRFEEMLAVIQPLIVDGDMGRLIVRPLCGPDGQRLLLLEEQPTAGATIQQLRRLNLTAREAQVLHGVIQGCTNPQVGAQLGISARTVQKHVEQLFRKLGVQTRTAAASRARELLGAVGV